MASFREARDATFLSNDQQLISGKAFLLLYDSY